MDFSPLSKTRWKIFSVFILALFFSVNTSASESGGGGGGWSVVDSCPATPFCINTSNQSQPQILQEQFLPGEVFTGSWQVNASGSKGRYHVKILGNSSNPYIGEDSSGNQSVEIQAKGLIPNEETVGEPFYIQNGSSNPVTCSGGFTSLGDQCRFSAEVNASGALGNYTAFFIANSTNSRIGEVESSRLTVTISNETEKRGFSTKTGVAGGGGFRFKGAETGDNFSTKGNTAEAIKFSSIVLQPFETLVGTAEALDWSTSVSPFFQTVSQMSGEPVLWAEVETNTSTQANGTGTTHFLPVFEAVMTDTVQGMADSLGFDTSTKFFLETGSRTESNSSFQAVVEHRFNMTKSTVEAVFTEEQVLARFSMQEIIPGNTGTGFQPIVKFTVQETSNVAEAFTQRISVAVDMYTGVDPAAEATGMPVLEANFSDNTSVTGYWRDTVTAGFETLDEVGFESQLLLGPADVIERTDEGNIIIVNPSDPDKEYIEVPLSFQQYLLDWYMGNRSKIHGVGTILGLTLLYLLYDYRRKGKESRIYKALYHNELEGEQREKAEEYAENQAQ